MNFLYGHPKGCQVQVVRLKSVIFHQYLYLTNGARWGHGYYGRLVGSHNYVDCTKTNMATINGDYDTSDYCHICSYVTQKNCEHGWNVHVCCGARWRLLVLTANIYAVLHLHYCSQHYHNVHTHYTQPVSISCLRIFHMLPGTVLTIDLSCLGFEYWLWQTNNLSLFIYNLVCVHYELEKS